MLYLVSCGSIKSCKRLAAATHQFLDYFESFRIDFEATHLLQDLLDEDDLLIVVTFYFQLEKGKC